MTRESRKESTRDGLDLSERSWTIWVCPSCGTDGFHMGSSPCLRGGRDIRRVKVEVVPAPTEGAVVTGEMIERGAAALWRDRGYSSPAVRNQLRSQAEAVLRAALEVTDDQ